MANKDFPGGMVPVRNEHGTVPKLEPFTVADSTEIFMYQPLAVNGDGLVIPLTHHLAEDGKCIGVSSQYLSATATDREIMVYSDPEQEYEMQSDDATLTGKGATIGRLFRINNIGSGNSTTGQSTAEIDGSSGASATGGAGDGSDTTPIRIEREVVSPNNDPDILHGRFVVRFCTFAMLRGSAGVGGDTDILQLGT